MHSCKLPDEDIEFKGIDNVSLKKIEGTKAYISAEAFFYNPNDIAMKLRQVKVGLEVDGKKVADVDQEKNVKIAAKSDFSVPLNVTFDLKESGLLDNILTLLGGKKKKLRFSGHIKASVYGVPFKAPIDHEEELKLR